MPVFISNLFFPPNFSRPSQLSGSHSYSSKCSGVLRRHLLSKSSGFVCGSSSSIKKNLIPGFFPQNMSDISHSEWVELLEAEFFWRPKLRAISLRIRLKVAEPELEPSAFGPEIESLPALLGPSAKKHVVQTKGDQGSVL
jgi:hypothetical protein